MGDPNHWRPGYFEDSRNHPHPQFTLTLDGLYSLSALVIWGYGGNANVASDFTVEFARTGGIQPGDRDRADERSPATIMRGCPVTHEANFVRITITKNAKGRGFSGSAGGDRVGLGEIRFVGSAVASNAPPVAPTYTAPVSLQVGVAITAMIPSGGADIHEYGAPGLPSGLSIDAGSGVISGTPDTANASTASVTVTVTDTAGNAATVPRVPGGGPRGGSDTAPLTAGYSATPAAVCTVDSGALTIMGAGDCEVTVTAAVTADYEVATAMFTVAVAQGAQTLSGFQYSSNTVTFGDTAPAVTMPSGAQGALSYSARRRRCARSTPSAAR